MEATRFNRPSLGFGSRSAPHFFNFTAPLMELTPEEDPPPLEPAPVEHEVIVTNVPQGRRARRRNRGKRGR
ncbi:hypothetical protein BH11PAT2_BH11PAT2_09270 [soil metagenome]